MLRKLTIYAVVAFVFLLVTAYASIAVPIEVSSPGSDASIERLPYAQRGPHRVGVQKDMIEIEERASLPIVVWYPAVADSNQQHTYPYPIKMGDSFMLTLATSGGQATRNAPHDEVAAPYPLVILSPGFSTGATAYGWLAEHLASHGFVVIAPDHVEHFDGELNGLWQSPITRPQEIMDVLDYVDEQAAPGGAFEGLIDADTVAIIGHSYGGYTTLAAAGAQIDATYLHQHCEEAHETEHPAAWLCDTIVPNLDEMATLAGFDAVPEGLWQMPADPRIDAIVPMAGDAFHFGPNGLAEITVPVLAISGTSDMDSPFAWSTQMTYDHVSSPRKVMVGLEGAEHMIFTAQCEAIPLLPRLMSDEFCADGDWNRDHAHNLVSHFATAFLLAELNADADALNALAPQTIDVADITYEAQGY